MRLSNTVSLFFVCVLVLLMGCGGGGGSIGGSNTTTPGAIAPVIYGACTTTGYGIEPQQCVEGTTQSKCLSLPTDYPHNIISSNFLGANSHCPIVEPPAVEPPPKGDISFVLTWSWTGSSKSGGPDIDMWVADPRGQELSSSRNGYGLGPSPDGGLIDYDDRGGFCYDSDCGPKDDGGGPERAYWPTGKALHGTYTYGVRYYQGDGTANYTLKVYIGTNIVSTMTGVLTAPSIQPGPEVRVGNTTY